MRIFIAIDISDQAKKEVGKFYKVLKRKHWKIKWESPEKLHLTLAFLGRQEGDKLQPIKQACQSAIQGINPFEISFKGLGCFPDYDQPRVIWLGFKGDLKTLAKLQKQLYHELKAKSFPLKARPFSPHITLGRIKKARFRERREIGRQLKKLRIMDFEVKDNRLLRDKSKTLVDRVIIYESKLSRTGSVYKKLEEIIFSRFPLRFV